MKKSIFITLIAILFSAGFAKAQTATDSLPYIKYPTMPAFMLLSLDSQNVLNTYNIPEGKPTLLMFFSPDCDHCEMITDTLIKHMDDLKHVQICMFSPTSLTSLKAFYDKKELKKYRNIIVAKDYEAFFPKFYKAYYVPYLVLYDKHKQYVKVFEGGGRWEDIHAALQK